MAWKGVTLRYEEDFFYLSPSPTHYLTVYYVVHAYFAPNEIIALETTTVTFVHSFLANG